MNFIQDYPVSHILPELFSGISHNPITVLEAAPGAGKSTIVPLALLQEKMFPGKKIIMLEPRRLAAKSVALRMADLLSEEAGQSVGYRIRHEKVPAKKIEVVTEGLLTRIIQNDPGLEEYGLIIFDEFHERSLHADLAYALTREIQKQIRPDLKILIMSATLGGASFMEKIPEAAFIRSEGKMHPLTFTYSGRNNQAGPAENTVPVIRQALREQKGDLLVFLPGIGDINRALKMLEEESGILVTPMHGGLPFSEQQKALFPDRHGLRKVVLATSIAETSLTIEGISTVIDSGFSRVPKFNPATGLSSLATIPSPMDVVTQRAGRAGRLGPGHCYRVWDEAYNHFIPKTLKPEIEDADLSNLVLEVFSWGAKKAGDLDWITPPPESLWTYAEGLLKNLGAIENGKITERGKEMLKFPAHPRIAHMILEARKTGKENPAIHLAALLEERDFLPREAGAGIMLRLEEWSKFRAGNYRGPYRKILERLETSVKNSPGNFNRKEPIFSSAYEIGKVLYFAYPDRAARRVSKGQYRLSSGKIFALEPFDELNEEEFLVIPVLDPKPSPGKILLASPLAPDDLLSGAREFSEVVLDQQSGELVRKSGKKSGALVLEEKVSRDLSEEEKAEQWEKTFAQKGLDMLQADEQYREWILRMQLFKKHLDASLEIPDESFIKKNFRTHILPWFSAARKVSDFKKVSLKEIVASLVDYKTMDEINRHIPETMEVPTGSKIKIQYTGDETPPVLAVRLQELFGLTETPTIAGGKIKLLIHLLSPAYRPVQVTSDLYSFWKNTYPEVRKELRIRYQKHHWPEDPFTAEPMRGPKKRKPGKN
jgi:ATP-dependent helicase HrpB